MSAYRGTSMPAPNTARSGTNTGRYAPKPRVQSTPGAAARRASQNTGSKSTGTGGTNGTGGDKVATTPVLATRSAPVRGSHGSLQSKDCICIPSKARGDYGRVPTWETSGGGLQALTEDHPYFGIAQPNYQKFSKAWLDPSQSLEKRIKFALEHGHLQDLQEVYRLACSRDGQCFRVESRLIGKVVRRIQESALEELKEAAASMDLATCERIQEQIKTDSTLAPLAKSKEYAKICALMDISEACKLLDFKGRGKKEPSISKQQKYLEKLRDAIKRGAAAGLAAKDLAAGRAVEQQIGKKLRVLDRLQGASQSKDDKELLEAILEAEECGLESSELTKIKAKALHNLMEKAVVSNDINALRDYLGQISLLDPSLQDPERTRQGWKKVCKADIIEAASGSSANELRAAIKRCKEKGFGDSLSEIISQAEQRLPDLERKENSSKASIARLEVAVYGRDVAQVQAWLNEAKKAGAAETLINRANAVLCEDALQKAISDRNGPRLEHLIKEGQQLSVDPGVLDCALRILEQDDPKAAVLLRISDALARKNTDALRDAVEDARSLGVDDSKMAEAVRVVEADNRARGIAPKAIAKKRSSLRSTTSPPPASSPMQDTPSQEPEMRKSVSFSERPDLQEVQVQVQEFQVDPQEHFQEELPEEEYEEELPNDFEEEMAENGYAEGEGEEYVGDEVGEPAGEDEEEDDANLTF